MAGTIEAQPLKKPLGALHIHRLLIGHIVPVWREMFIAQDNVTVSACKAGASLQRVSVKLFLVSATLRKCGSCPVTFILQCGSNTPLITHSTSPCLTTKEIMKTNLIPGSTRLFFLDRHPGRICALWCQAKSPQWKFGTRWTGVNFDRRDLAEQSINNGCRFDIGR